MSDNSQQSSKNIQEQENKIGQESHIMTNTLSDHLQRDNYDLAIIEGAIKQQQQTKEIESEIQGIQYHINVIEPHTSRGGSKQNLQKQSDGKSKKQPQTPKSPDTSLENDIASHVKQQTEQICADVGLQKKKSLKVYEQYVACLDQLDQIDRRKNKCRKNFESNDEEINKQEVFVQLNESQEKIFNSYIQINLHPKAQNQIGEHLLRNGKFVTGFINFLTKNEKKNYLKKYLFEYFSNKNQIQDDLLVFNDRMRECFADQIVPSDSKQRVHKTQKDFQPQKKLQIQVQQQNYDKEEQNQIYSVQKYECLHSDNRIQSKQSKKSHGKTKLQNKSVSKKKSYSSQVKLQKQLRKLGVKKEDLDNLIKNDDLSEFDEDKHKVKQSRKKSNRKSEVSFEKNELSQEEQKTKLGSFYHYKISTKNKRDNKKHISQVRASARLSKKKGQIYEQGRKSVKSRTTKSRKSKQRIKQRPILKESQDYQKSDQSYDPREDQENQKYRKTNKQPYAHQSETQTDQNSEIIEVDWVKNHLKEIQFDHIQLYDDFKALTHKDRQLTRFLLSLERERKIDEGQSVSMEQSESLEQICQNNNLENVENLNYSNNYQNTQFSQQSQPQYIDQEYKKLLYQNNEQIKQVPEESERKNDEKQGEKDKIFIKSDSNPHFISNLSHNEERISPFPRISETQPAQNNKNRILQDFDVQREKAKLLQKKRKFKIQEQKNFPCLIDHVIDPNLNGHGIYALVKLSRLTQIQYGAKYALTPLAIHYKYSRKAIKEDIQKARDLLDEFHKENLAFLPISSETLRIIENHVQNMKKGQ